MFNTFLTFWYKKAPDFLQNSLIFSVFLCFSPIFHGYSIKFRIFASV